NYTIDDNIKTIYDKNDNDPSKRIVANNEIIIRNIYGELINKITSKIKKPTAINSDFVYAIIAEESKFNPNAISHTGVRGLGQIQESTLADILIRNKNGHLENKIIDGSNFEDIFLYNNSLIETNRKFTTESKNGVINYNGLDTELYHPEIAIKGTINYLLFLEGLFEDVKNNNLKRYLISASYNMGATGLKRVISEKGKEPKNYNELISILDNNKETQNYVKRVNYYYLQQKNFR
ncbi:MAG: transglycosylase SLT domain-containing protein, partial [Candidatus Gracilibacteria bacterium]|nr:transglycosylase SLT domain-containing protein [Candidatus Gracilibacteria bacterium]